VQCDRAGDTVGVIVRVRHHQGQSASAPHADNDLIESWLSLLGPASSTIRTTSGRSGRPRTSVRSSVAFVHMPYELARTMVQLLVAERGAGVLWIGMHAATRCAQNSG
jgi:hypothetical protein